MNTVLANIIMFLALPLGRAQAWCARVWRQGAWYAPVALLGWGLTRPPFVLAYKAAIKLTS